MNYVMVPNLPEGEVRLAAVDGRINKAAEDILVQQGVQLIKTLPYPGILDAIAYHPDIILHHTGYDGIVYAPGTDIRLVKHLQDYGFRMIKGEHGLSLKYPADIAYNVARVGRFAFHNLLYTDPVLKKELERQDIEFVHINQGYAKCSISVVNSSSIITSDVSIARAAEKKGIDALLLLPDSNIVLPGLSCGFIGGCSGLVGKKRWFLSGSLENLDSCLKVRAFLESKDIGIVCPGDSQVIDIGSILPLMEE